MHYQGLIIGFVVFATIGLFHPIVVKLEYYYGQKPKLLLAFIGICLIAISFFAEILLSIFLACLGFSCLWAALEIAKQGKRVIKGRAKANPKRLHK